MRTSKGVAVCDRALLFYNPIVVAQVNASLRGVNLCPLSENHYKDGVEGGVVFRKNCFDSNFTAPLMAQGPKPTIC